MENQVLTKTQEQLLEVLKSGLSLRLAAGRPIGPQTPIFGKEGLGLDSVDVLEIAVLLDKHFGVQLQEEDAPSRAALENIASLADFIDRQKALGQP